MKLDQHFVACISFPELENCTPQTAVVFIAVVVIVVVIIIIIIIFIFS